MPPFISQLLIAQAQPAGGTRELIDSLARTPLSKVVTFVVVLSVVRLLIYPFLSRTTYHLRGVLYALARFANEMLDAFIYAGVFVFMLIRPFGVQAFLIPSGSMWPTLGVNTFIVANKAVYRYTDPKVDDIVVFRPPPAASLSPDQLDSEGEMKLDFIKRCVGTPGDMVVMRQGVLYRNGAKIAEPYTTYSECSNMPPQPGAECQDFRPLTGDELDHITKVSFKLVKFKGRIIPLTYTEEDGNAPYPKAENIGERFAPYHTADEYVIPEPAEERAAEESPAQKIPPGMYLMMGDNRNNSFDGRGWGLVPRDQIIGRSEFVWWPLSEWHVTR